MRGFGSIGVAALLALAACGNSESEPAADQPTTAAPSSAATQTCAEFPKNPDVGEGTRPVMMRRACRWR